MNSLTTLLVIFLGVFANGCFAQESSTAEIIACYLPQIRSNFGLQSADQVLAGCIGEYEIGKYEVDTRDFPDFRPVEAKDHNEVIPGVNPFIDPVRL